MPENDFTYLPERAPFAVIIVAGIGVGVALLTAYEVDPVVIALGARPGVLVIVRLAWHATALGFGLAAAASLYSGTKDANGTAAIASNVVLFSALATFPVALGRADLAWFPGALLVLAALRFGWEGTDRNSFQWWAAFLAPTPTEARGVVAVGLWVLATAVTATAGSRDSTLRSPLKRLLSSRQKRG